MCGSARSLTRRCAARQLRVDNSRRPVPSLHAFQMANATSSLAEAGRGVAMGQFQTGAVRGHAMAPRQGAGTIGPGVPGRAQTVPTLGSLASRRPPQPVRQQSQQQQFGGQSFVSPPSSVMGSGAASPAPSLGTDTLPMSLAASSLSLFPSQPSGTNPSHASTGQ